MLTPSQFRQQFPGDPKDAPPDRGLSPKGDGAGCLSGCLGVAALSAVLLSASFGMTRCQEVIEGKGDKSAPTAPMPPEEGRPSVKEQGAEQAPPQADGSPSIE